MGTNWWGAVSAGTEWVKALRCLATAAASQPPAINNNKGRSSSRASLLCQQRAINLDVVREESATVAVLPDQELVLANLDSLQVQPLIWVPHSGKPKAVRRPPARNKRLGSEFPPRSFLFFLFFLQQTKCYMEIWFYWERSTTARLEDKKTLPTATCVLQRLSFLFGSKVVQQRCGQRVKGKLNLDVKDLWIGAFQKNLNLE